MRRFRHNLSHYRLQTLMGGNLVPVACLEVLPGDTFRHQTSLLLRVMPMVAPVMHPYTVRIAHWYVPNRIVWPQWEDFVLEQNGVTQVPTQSIPAGQTLIAGGLTNSLGIPTGTYASAFTFNALPFMAYNQIWNDHYRRAEIEPEIPLNGTPALQRVAWERDYYTDARTAPQLGAASTVPVMNPAVLNSPIAINTVTGAFSVEALRAAQMLQRIRERRNRGGNTYDDFLRFYGVPIDQSRLSQPEYLGGATSVVSFSEVLATSAGTDLGDMGGHGIAALRVPPYRRFFPEHGYVLTLLSLRPKTMYMGSVTKKFLRMTQADYYTPEGEVLGDEAILNREVWASQTTTPNGVFGWAPRYESYRREPSEVTGEFETVKADWHFARNFAAQPTLNSSFVRADPARRPFADQVAHSFAAMVVHQIAARRPVSNRSRTENAANA